MKTTILLVCLVILTGSGCRAQQKSGFEKESNTNTLLWQVNGKGLSKPSFLFGTFHLMCKDDIKFSEQLRSAIRYADEIYMEMDLDDSSMLMSGLLYMNMKDGKTLKDLYNAEEYKKIEKYFNDTLQMPLLFFQKAKPYLLMALLYPKMMNCATFSGVEEELLKVIKENHKEIKGLETMEFQSSIFDSIPYELQAKELIKNIDSLSNYAGQFDSLMQAYKNQDLKLLEKGLNESDFGMDKYEDLLLNRRNANWITQLKEIMKTRSVVVAVGAGHLLGDKGLINLLKKEGYLVTPLKNR